MKKTALGSTSENLMEQIVELRNIERAWKKVKANGGAPGFDGVDLDEFFRTFRDAMADRSTATVGGNLRAVPGSQEIHSQAGWL